MQIQFSSWRRARGDMHAKRTLQQRTGMEDARRYQQQEPSPPPASSALGTPPPLRARTRKGQLFLKGLGPT